MSKAVGIFLRILLILLTMCWCAEVFAHNDGNPQAHFEPYTASDPCWDLSCLNEKYKNGHGHIDSDDSWGYWTCLGYKYLFPEHDCEGAGRLEDGKAGRLEDGKAGRLEDGKAGRLEDGKTGRREDGKAGERSQPIAVVLEQIIEDEPEPPEAIEIPEVPAPPVAPVESWEVQFHRGLELGKFPGASEGR